MRTHLQMDNVTGPPRTAPFFYLGLMLFAVAGCAQEDGYQPPATDIFLSEILTDGGRPALGPPRNLTDRDGYDNQPVFMPDGSTLLFTSSRKREVDVYSYNLATDETRRLTTSPEREYSPAPVPGYEGFSCVRVESDGSQRLWQFDPDGRDAMLLLEWEDDVGYYAWIDSDVVALRLEDDPTELRFADVDVGWVERESVMKNVGRSLHRVPGKNAISFVHTDPEGEWWITELDLMLREATRIVATLPGCQDYAWTPSGELLMAQGSRMYHWSAEKGGGWAQIADFAAAGIQNITRLAVSPDGQRLAFVSDRPGPEH